jgi:hypothetical protein
MKIEKKLFFFHFKIIFTNFYLFQEIRIKNIIV